MDFTKPPSTKRRWLFPVAVIVLLVPLTALALWAEGRLFSCSCGEFQFWVGNTCSSRNSQQLFDPYSFTHILHGFLLFWLVALLFKNLSPPWQLTLAAILEALWEVLENTNFVIDRYRAQTAALGYTGDTVINSIGDLFCAIVGFLIARRLGWFRSLIAFLLLEVVLFFWIRDSLLLQILMLIYPVNALKYWQMCR
ncbi:MAG TPA: DUF2585 family protein [Pyrinomonadaceae bacterium]|jgi:hypothetical protein|nr:DUF2585 family protein [Pyrinomonadaceae bacterium]